MNYGVSDKRFQAMVGVGFAADQDRSRSPIALEAHR